MTRERKHLLAAGGFLLLSLVFVWMTIEHLTCDESELRGRDPVIGKWARLDRWVYETGGRTGRVVLDLAFLAVGVACVVGSLKKSRAWAPSGATASASFQPIPENPACGCCGLAVTGRLDDDPEDEAADVTAYRCGSCGAFVCKACTEKRIPFSRWDGRKRSPCPVCGKPFNPQTALRSR
jgi:hypothetical protein